MLAFNCLHVSSQTVLICSIYMYLFAVSLQFAKLRCNKRIHVSESFACRWLLQNLSPVLTKMAKEVDGREKELTHQVHREWLQRSLEQVKQLTPQLISGIKIFVTTKGQGTQSRRINYLLAAFLNKRQMNISMQVYGFLRSIFLLLRGVF